MGQINKITVEEAKELLDKNEAILIDVREAVERKALYIPGSSLVPLSSISPDKIKDCMQDNKKTLLHCRSGKRSMSACEKVSSDIDADFYNVEGGILEWQEKGYPVM
jgi:rhodanese-related sulfurtransferase